MSWLQEIKNHRKKKYSQCGEEGFIEFILKNLGIESGNILEFGAGDGVGLSNSLYFIEKGWNALRFDGNPKGSTDVIQAWIDTDYVDGLLNKYDKFDVVMIDLDGNDYYILDVLLGSAEHSKHPALVVCEINPAFERHEAKAIEYSGSHTWQGTTYYGMSLAAAETMMETHGYKLVFVNDSLNAYFVKAELLPDEVINIEYRKKLDHPKGSGNWVEIGKTYSTQ
jgi:hypothetical protein